MQPLLDLVGRRCREGTLELVTPEGGHWQLGRGEPVTAIRLRSPAVLRRMLSNPIIAFAEAYVDGDWQPANHNLAEVLQICIRNLDALAPDFAAVRWYRRMRARMLERNSRRRAQTNACHYHDIDYSLYRRFLDRDLHYSCAYFRNPDDTLEAAQQAKCEHIAAKLDLRPGALVLDIGCGWGSLAMYLAERHGVHCVGITLSQEQLKIARRRAHERGLEQQVEFHLQDYREGFALASENFHAIVSVGMFEHVGRPQYVQFFRRIHALLADDGVALVHTIGRFSSPTSCDPWIDKYIFPGGYIPAASEMLAAVEKSGLIGSDLEYWRQHYAFTLDHWNARFQATRANTAASMGERFCRMWEFYLQASAASFRYGDLCVFQLQMAKTLGRLPATRDYQYATDAATRLSEACPVSREAARA